MLYKWEVTHDSWSFIVPIADHLTQENNRGLGMINSRYRISMYFEGEDSYELQITNVVYAKRSFPTIVPKIHASVFTRKYA